MRNRKNRKEDERELVVNEEPIKGYRICRSVQAFATDKQKYRHKRI